MWLPYRVIALLLFSLCGLSELRAANQTFLNTRSYSSGTSGGPMPVQVVQGGSMGSGGSHLVGVYLSNPGATGSTLIPDGPGRQALAGLLPDRYIVSTGSGCPLPAYASAGTAPDSTKAAPPAAGRLQGALKPCDVPVSLYLPLDYASLPPLEPAEPGHDPLENLQERASAIREASGDLSQLGTFLDELYLLDLARAYSAQAASQSDELYGKILRDRAQALQIAASDPSAEMHAQFSDPFDQQIVELFPELSSLQAFRGNLAQYRLYQEVGHHLQEAYAQWRDGAFMDRVTATTPLVFNLLSSAASQTNPEVAFGLADAGYHLLSFSKLMHAAWDGCRALDNVRHQILTGIAKGTMNTAAAAAGVAKWLYNHRHLASKAGVAQAWEKASDCLSKAFGALIVMSAESDNPYIKEQQRILREQRGALVETSARAAAAWVRNTCESPENFAEAMTELLWGHLLATGAIKGVAKGTQALTTALKRNQQLAWALEDLRMARLRVKDPQYAAAISSRVGEFESCFEGMLLSDAELAAAADKMRHPVEQAKILASGCSAEVAEQFAQEYSLVNGARAALHNSLEEVAARRPFVYTKELLATMRDIPLTQGVEVVLKGAVAAERTSGPSTIFLKDGGWAAALRDFDRLPLLNGKATPRGRAGFLADGRTVNVRSTSSHADLPTVEISNKATGNKLKIRYLEGSQANLK